MENGVLAKVDVTKRIESKSKYNKKLEKISKALISVAANSKRRKNRSYARYGRLGCSWKSEQLNE